MKPMTIGRVARRSGVGVETIRFYERQGLIERPPRKQSGYRLYPDEVISRLHFIRRAKDLGFSLKEIKELLSLRMDPGSTCDDVRRRAVAKLKDVEGKIRMLEKIKTALARLTSACSGRGSVGECPILEVMDGKEK